MVFADANQLCGIGTLYNDLRRTDNYNDGFAASFARVDANCWSAASSVPAHELTHTIGGVQQGAPHATPYGHCSDDADIMCYDDGSGIPVEQVCAAAQEDLLDCNHDDYFSTAPAPGTFLADNWNTAELELPRRRTRAGLAPGRHPRLVRQSTAETGDTVTFTATSTHDVTWAWSTTSGVRPHPRSSGTADPGVSLHRDRDRRGDGHGHGRRDRGRGIGHVERLCHPRRRADRAGHRTRHGDDRRPRSR